MTERPYRRLSPLTPLARGGILLVAAASSVWRDVTRGDIGPTAGVLVAVLVVGSAVGFASWYRTKFWIEADELRVDTGLVSRQSRRIRVDRLQGVDIVQPFLARLLGLAELRMDVAGGRAREGSLAFLSVADARELKDVLLTRRDELRAGGTQPPPDPGTAAPGTAAPGTAAPGGAAPGGAAPGVPAAERVLARVDLATLAGSIVLTVEAVVLLLAAVGVVVGSLLSGHLVAVSAVVPVLGGLVLVLFRRLTGGYGLTVAETAAGLQVRRGLFDRNVQTITLARVQGVVVAEPLLWRRLGWARVDVSVAGYASSGDRDGPAASTVLPVGRRDLAVWLAGYLLGGLATDETPLSGPPEAARWVAPVRRRFMSAATDEHVVVSREGMLTRRTHVVPRPRIQSRRITAGPWQRRLGLADVHVDSPPGPARVRARHRDAREARAFFEALDRRVGVSAARNPADPA